MMNERRRHPRLKLDLPVTLRHRGRLIPATMLNLSCGGMRISAPRMDLDGGAPVEVIFDIDQGARDVSLSGRVTRVEASAGQTNMGVEFTSLFSMSHKAVEEYLRNHLN